MVRFLTQSHETLGATSSFLLEIFLPLSRTELPLTLRRSGNPNQNLASFVHTWVPKEATQLMVENMNKVGLYWSS